MGQSRERSATATGRFDVATDGRLLIENAGVRHDLKVMRLGDSEIASRSAAVSGTLVSS